MMEPNIAALRRISFFYALSNALLGACLALLAVLLGFLHYARPILTDMYKSQGIAPTAMTKLVQDVEIGIALPLAVFVALLLVFKEMRMGNKTATSWINFVVLALLFLALGFCAAGMLAPLQAKTAS